MLIQCNLLSRATVGIRHFLPDRNKDPREAVCEPLTHLLLSFHAYVNLSRYIYKYIVANKSIKHCHWVCVKWPVNVAWLNKLWDVGGFNQPVKKAMWHHISVHKMVWKKTKNHCVLAGQTFSAIGLQIIILLCNF